jgi:hypothetical protein
MKTLESVTDIWESVRAAEKANQEMMRRDPLICIDFRINPEAQTLESELKRFVNTPGNMPEQVHDAVYDAISSYKRIISPNPLKTSIYRLTDSLGITSEKKRHCQKLEEIRKSENKLISANSMLHNEIARMQENNAEKQSAKKLKLLNELRKELYIKTAKLAGIKGGIEYCMQPPHRIYGTAALTYATKFKYKYL